MTAAKDKTVSTIMPGIVARFADLKFDFIGVQPNGGVFIWRSAFASDHSSASAEGTPGYITPTTDTV